MQFSSSNRSSRASSCGMLRGLGLLRPTSACSTSNIVPAKERSSNGAGLIAWARHFARHGEAKPIFSGQAPCKRVEGWDRTSIRYGLSKEDEDGEEDAVEWKNKVERRREVLRAYQKAKLLVTFTEQHIKDAVKFAFLPDSTLHAALLAQRLKMDGLNQPKRRQLRYIANLIRKAEPNLVEYVFFSLKDDQSEKLRKVMVLSTACEREKQVQRTAEAWLRGLLTGDKSIEDEVYALPIEYLDKAQVRQAIRNVKVQASKQKVENDPLQGFMHRDLHRARKALTKLLEEAAVYALSAREELPMDDSALLEEHGASQDMQAEAFLSHTAAQVLEVNTLVHETGCERAVATVMVEQAAQQEREVLAMAEEAQYQELAQELMAGNRDGFRR